MWCCFVYDRGKFSAPRNYDEGGKELVEPIDKQTIALSFHIQSCYLLDFTQLHSIYHYKTEEYSHTVVKKFYVIPESIPDWVFDFMTESGEYLIGNFSLACRDFRWLIVADFNASLSSATPAQATTIIDLIKWGWEDLIGEMPLQITYLALEGHQRKIAHGCDPKNTQRSYPKGGSWPVVLSEQGGKELVEPIDKETIALSFHIQSCCLLDFTQLHSIYHYKTEYSHTVVKKFYVIPESIPDWVFDFMTESGEYLIGNFSPACRDFRWLIVVDFNASLSSATPAQATTIIDLIKWGWEDLIGEMPLQITYLALEGHQRKIAHGCDPKNTQWSYPKGGSWPVVLWLLKAASIKAGRLQIATRAMGCWSKASPKTGGLNILIADCALHWNASRERSDMDHCWLFGCEDYDGEPIPSSHDFN